MGKPEEEQSGTDLLHVLALPERNAGDSCPRCRSVVRILQLRCVAAVLFGFAALLSAVFWLPPFLRADPGGRVDIVASFILHKPVSFVNANADKLEYDIFEEIGVPNSLVGLLSLETLSGSNWTNVVFGIWLFPKRSTIPSTALSLLRSSFMTLGAQTSTLHLTTSLFGDSYFFQVRKFPNGITIIPTQSVFLLQKEQMLFNFTLNFPIYQVQGKFSELKDQMKMGLFLNSYENLYVRLTNLKGSTVNRPTIVEACIVLAVGNKQPSMPRLKELAQTIRNSSVGNLGLNHTIFGSVKQIRLSSFLQHSLYSSGSSNAPSPAPQHSLHRCHHHHHQHHHHHHHCHHHSGLHMAPASTPAPDYIYQAPPPTGRCFGIPCKSNIAHLVPTAAPMAPGQHASADSVPSSAPLASRHHWYASLPHEASPSPAPRLASLSPLPNVYFSRAQPPSDTVTEMNPLSGRPSISPSPSSSCSVAGQPSLYCALIPLLYFLIRT